MKDWFLFRLYWDPAWFPRVIPVHTGLCLLPDQQMDMMVFLYNAMFAYDRKPGGQYHFIPDHGPSIKDIHHRIFSYWKKGLPGNLATGVCSLPGIWKYGFMLIGI